jgi:hypothetical protein
VRLTIYTPVTAESAQRMAALVAPVRRKSARSILEVRL